MNHFRARAAWLVIAMFSFIPAASAQQLDEATVDGWFETLSNWGRWGPDDEKGTVNLITEETRVAAARLVRTGVSVSMAHELLEEEAADNFSPFDHRMTSVEFLFTTAPLRVSGGTGSPLNPVATFQAQSSTGNWAGHDAGGYAVEAGADGTARPD